MLSQSLFGRAAAVTALQLTDCPSAMDTGFTKFESVFKSMWGDNADVMSLLYTGTGALKTDVTRCVVCTRYVHLRPPPPSPSPAVHASLRL